jgi:hypothetical protein
MADHEQSTPAPVSYEPPRVERVLTPGELEHEILYAGGPASDEDEVSTP